MRAGMAGIVGVAAMALAFAGGLSLGPTTRNPDAANSAGTVCSKPAQPMARVELLFGASRSDGSVISDEEWRAFLDAEVTPRFPDGLTVLSGNGQWRNAAGRITRERSRVLLVWYIARTGRSAEIDAIRDTYKRQFAQESVLRVDGTGCVSF